MLINGYTTKAAALRALNKVLEAHGYGKISGLLADPLSNPKVAKNGKLIGVMTFPMHLAPASLGGFNVCAQASEGCKAACLHTAGNPVYMAGKTRSRIAKVQGYFRARTAFMAVLAFEIAAARRKAAKAGMECAIRLNATSDIAWERVPVMIDGGAGSLMEHHPDLSFYDYTKITKRALQAANADPKWPANYHLTFSKAEDNDVDVLAVLRAGGNVSIVFDRKHRLPGFVAPSGTGLAVHPWGGWQVTDGDAHDYRPADPAGCIVGLKAKGDARNDTSGFVMR